MTNAVPVGYEHHVAPETPHAHAPPAITWPHPKPRGEHETMRERFAATDRTIAKRARRGAAMCLTLVMVTACSRSIDQAKGAATTTSTSPVNSTSTTAAPTPACAALWKFEFAEMQANLNLDNPNFVPTDPKIPGLISALNSSSDAVAGAVPDMKDNAARRVTLLVRQLHGERPSQTDIEVGLEARDALSNAYGSACPDTNEFTAKCRAIRAFILADWSTTEWLKNAKSKPADEAARYTKSLDATAARLSNVAPELAGAAARRAVLVKKQFEGKPLSAPDQAEATSTRQQLDDAQKTSCPK